MKYSRQRELICQAVQRSADHPTAEMLYMALHEANPSLSLATIYRNLGQLCEAGRLRRVAVPGGSDRYDGTLEGHDHLICDGCGGISDVHCDLSALPRELSGSEGCAVRSIELIVHGTCRSCLRKAQRN